jgi:hypothetical protein
MLSLVVYLIRAAPHGLVENVLGICLKDVPRAVCNAG